MATKNCIKNLIIEINACYPQAEDRWPDSDVVAVDISTWDRLLVKIPDDVLSKCLKVYIMSDDLICPPSINSFLEVGEEIKEQGNQ